MSKENMVRWSGFSLILAGLLVALATLIHPSKETAQSILAQETRLIAGHWLFTLYCVFFLLGLPGLYAANARQLGRLGLVGFLLLFAGTVLFAVSDDYGFNAPVLARMAPQTLDALNTYPSNEAMNGLFVVLQLVGFPLFGIALRRARDLPAWSGILIAVGWPLFIIASGLALTVFEPLWNLAVLGTFLLGVGLAWAGYAMWSEKAQTEVVAA